MTRQADGRRNTRASAFARWAIRHGWKHAILVGLAFLTLVPFAFVLNNSFRSNAELYHAFFGWPRALGDVFTQLGLKVIGKEAEDSAPSEGSAPVGTAAGDASQEPSAAPGPGLHRENPSLVKGYRQAWRTFRLYMSNTLIVCSLSALGVVFIGSLTAYVLARYTFPGSRAIFYFIISTMMIPAVLTLVPGFLLMKSIGLLDTYRVLILPYIAGGQVFAIFVFHSFFRGIPDALFEAAKIDGAGHLRQYFHIVLPLSKPVLAVVAIMNILATWNNFMWPFITNQDSKYHVISNGLYVMGQTVAATDFQTMFAAYTLSSIPLLLLFVFATKPFLQGVTSGAFKA